MVLISKPTEATTVKKAIDKSGGLDGKPNASSTLAERKASLKSAAEKKAESTLGTTESLEVGAVMTGKIATYNPTNGYGFIHVEGEGKDIFLSHVDLGGRVPQKGDAVSFTIGTCAKGPIAKDIIFEVMEGREGQERYKGFIKSFNHTKGFGFLTSDFLEDQDIFFPMSEIDEQAQWGMKIGSWCNFSMKETEKGPQASRISFIGAAGDAIYGGGAWSGKGGKGGDWGGKGKGGDWGGGMGDGMEALQYLAAAVAMIGDWGSAGGGEWGGQFQKGKGKGFGKGFGKKGGGLSMQGIGGLSSQGAGDELA